MKWTLYLQYDKGLHLDGKRRRPRAITQVDVVSDPPYGIPTRMLAFQQVSVVAEIHTPVISMQADGIRVVGFERWSTVKGDRAAYQEWWLMPVNLEVEGPLIQAGGDDG